jgi:molecular chaperone DnaJ
MTRKRALTILGLKEGADLEEIKRAYRKLAFALHPDLHPDSPNAGKDFQQLNEAYVFLSSPENASSSARSASRGNKLRNDMRKEATERARAEARKAYDKAKERFKGEGPSQKEAPPKAASGQDTGKKARNMNKDEVLQDLLRDPFARRVFEDIYSQIKNEAARKQGGSKTASSAGRSARSYRDPTEPGLLECHSAC